MNERKKESGGQCMKVSLHVISNVPDCSTNLIIYWTSISTFKKLFLKLFRLKPILKIGIGFL